MRQPEETEEKKIPIFVAHFGGSGDLLAKLDQQVDAYEKSFLGSPGYPIGKESAWYQKQGIQYWGYPGCSVKEDKVNYVKMVTALGTNDRCDKFISDLKRHLKDIGASGKIYVYLFGVSRGAVSALKAVKEIQQDPELNQVVEISIELHDPVPGNLGPTSFLGVPGTAISLTKDLSKCWVVKRAHIILTQLPLEKFPAGIGFSPFIPNFHPLTKMETEILPLYHTLNPPDHAESISWAIFLIISGRKRVFQHWNDRCCDSRHLSMPPELVEVLEKLELTLNPSKSLEKFRRLHFGGSVKGNIFTPPTNISRKQAMEAKNQPDVDDSYLQDHKNLVKVSMEIESQQTQIDRKTVAGEKFCQAIVKLKELLIQKAFNIRDAAARCGNEQNYCSIGAYQLLEGLSKTLVILNSSDSKENKFQALATFQKEAPITASIFSGSTSFFRRRNSPMRDFCEAARFFLDSQIPEAVVGCDATMGLKAS